MGKAKRSDGKPRGALDRRYLEALARGDAAAADAIIDEAHSSGWTLEQLYLHLLVPAQAEIGARWRARRLSVADEHLATEITLAQMERLRARLKIPASSGRRVVVACVEGESHAIGTRMLADFLLLDGWEVEYLGANTPTHDLVTFVARRRPDLVALSVTQSEYLPSLRSAAAALRGLTPAPRVLAGGLALHGYRSPAKLDVDGIAVDARTGLQEARRLVAPASASVTDSEDYFVRLGRRIQELRAAGGMTQQDLAAAADLDRTYISGLENGKQNPSLGVLIRLTRALEVPLERLVIPG
jgi:methanogenic corrinoid protein MtbC1/DNA-binding XRE family transcriptional regulator